MITMIIQCKAIHIKQPQRSRREQRTFNCLLHTIQAWPGGRTHIHCIYDTMTVSTQQHNQLKLFQTSQHESTAERNGSGYVTLPPILCYAAVRSLVSVRVCPCVSFHCLCATHSSLAPRPTCDFSGPSVAPIRLGLCHFC